MDFLSIIGVLLGFLPRPRDLEITYTPEFTDIVHELRGHIGAMRNTLQRTLFPPENNEQEAT